jgi:hypothetical protein
MKRPHDSDGLPTAKRVKPPPEVIRGDRPVYRFFLIWKDAKGNTHEVPARCLLDWGSTTFAISKRFVTAFSIPIIERTTAIESYNASGRRFEDDGKTRTYPLRFSFGNHCSDEVFEVMTMGDSMEVIVPYWWMQKHRASGVYDGTLRFNDCPSALLRVSTLYPPGGVLLTTETLSTYPRMRSLPPVPSHPSQPPNRTPLPPGPTSPR